MTDVRAVINPAVESALDSLHNAFESARPFKHVLIKDFFDKSILHDLLTQFPVADKEAMLNEFGRKSRKYARHDVRNLGPAFCDLDDYLKSGEFSGMMSTITGIPNLLYDPEYHGAGTHDNHEGQGMDAHVDFNLHRTTGYHRRLNAIIYLNPEWDPAWGGNLELHKNPWRAEADEIITYPPFLNHCVLFETNEYSWHGFQPITLPDGVDVSRKSFTVYMYTKDRPVAEIADKHATVYVPRPIPSRIKAGYSLTQADVEELQSEYKKRSQMISDFYEREKRFQSTITSLVRLSDKFRVPLEGWAQQIGAPVGIRPNLATARYAKLNLKITRPTSQVSIALRLPKFLPSNGIDVSINGVAQHVEMTQPRQLVISNFDASAGSEAVIEITCRDAISPFAAGVGPDKQEIGAYLESIIVE